MKRRRIDIGLLFAPLVAACTGAIAEPLSISSEVEPGGWLIVDDGTGAPVLLRRDTDSAETPRFVDRSGAVIASLDVQADDSVSVFTFAADELQFLEEWGQARVPELAELSIELAGTRLGDCACPVPTFDARVRFVAGATCVVPKARGQSVAWDGDAWRWSEGAGSELRLHHGGEACAPTVEALVAASSSGPALSMVASSLPPEHAPYTHLEWLDADSAFVVSASGSGILSADGSMVSWSAHPPPGYDVRMILAPEPGAVVGVVELDPTGDRIPTIVWFVREGVRVPPSRAPVLFEKIDDEQVRKWLTEEGLASLAVGSGGILLVGTASAAGGLIPIDLSEGRLLEREVQPRFAMGAPATTWVVGTDSGELELVVPDLPWSASPTDGRFRAQMLASRVYDFNRLDTFPRTDVAVSQGADEQGQRAGLVVTALNGDSFVQVPELGVVGSGACPGIDVDRWFATILNGRLRIITGAGYELLGAAGCLKLDVRSRVVSAKLRPGGKDWFLLAELGDLIGVSSAEADYETN